MIPPSPPPKKKPGKSWILEDSVTCLTLKKWQHYTLYTFNVHVLIHSGRGRGSGEPERRNRGQERTLAEFRHRVVVTVCSPCSLACRYDNPTPELNLSSCQGSVIQLQITKLGRIYHLYCICARNWLSPVYKISVC